MVGSTYCFLPINSECRTEDLNGHGFDKNKYFVIIICCDKVATLFLALKIASIYSTIQIVTFLHCCMSFAFDLLCPLSFESNVCVNILFLNCEMPFIREHSSLCSSLFLSHYYSNQLYYNTIK